MCMYYLDMSIVIRLASKVIKCFSCSIQLSLNFILLVYVKMPTVVGILTFIRRINVFYTYFDKKILPVLIILVFMSILNIMLR